MYSYFQILGGPWCVDLVNSVHLQQAKDFQNFNQTYYELILFIAKHSGSRFVYANLLFEMYTVLSSQVSLILRFKLNSHFIVRNSGGF